MHAIPVDTHEAHACHAGSSAGEAHVANAERPAEPQDSAMHEANDDDVPVVPVATEASAATKGVLLCRNILLRLGIVWASCMAHMHAQIMRPKTVSYLTYAVNTTRKQSSAVLFPARPEYQYSV